MNNVVQLTNAWFAMQAKLSRGYPTQRQKLDEIFFSQELPETRLIILPQRPLEVTTPVPNKPSTKHRQHTGTPRCLSGRVNIQVLYPSGTLHDARIKSLKDMCAIEPIAPETAFWLIKRKYLDGVEVLDLKTTPHKRQYHNQRGRAIIGEFR